MTMTRSGANGGFAITDASVGTHTVEARMIGYTPHRLTVQVKAEGQGSSRWQAGSVRRS